MSTTIRTKRRNGHVIARAPAISLAQPGRLRVAHIMALYGCAHSTVYKRIKEGRIPPCDGRDGRRPYWRTETIKKALAD